MSDRASDEVRRIVHAFPDQGRRDEVRELAAQVRAIEDERDELRTLLERAKRRITSQIAAFVDERLRMDRSSDAALYAIVDGIENGEWEAKGAP